MSDHQDNFSMDKHYNDYSKQQGKALQITSDLITKYLPPLLQKDIKIADFGCSEGKNAMEIVKFTISHIRKTNNNNNIQVYFEDLESNNWSEIFKIANKQLNQREVYFSAVGKTFYQRNFPNNYLDVAFSGNAFHWASELLGLKEGFLFPISSMNSEDKMNWNSLSKKDWDTILYHRSFEMKPGAILFANFAGFDEGSKDLKQFHWIQTLRKVILEFEKKGKITTNERKSLVMPVHLRNIKDIINQDLMDKHGFKVLFSKVNPIQDPYYENLQLNVKNGMEKEKAIQLYSQDIAGSKRAYGEYFYKLMFQNRSEKEKDSILNQIFDEFMLLVQKEHEKFKDPLSQVFIVLQKKIKK